MTAVVSSSEIGFFIVGASGFVGSAIYNEITRCGGPVLGTYNRDFRDSLYRLDLRHTDFNLDPCQGLNSCQRKVAVIVSACASIDYCGNEQGAAFQVNVTNTIKLIQELTALDFEIVFISTDNVFDGLAGGYCETDPVDPINEYGRQKVAVESFLQQKIPNSLILRLSKICAGYDHKNNLFSDWQGWVNAEAKILCIKEQLFSPTSAVDVGQVLLKLVRQNSSGIYHVVADTWERTALAQLFLTKIVNGANVEVVEKELASFQFVESRTQNSSLNNDKIIAATGHKFMPMVELIEQFVRETA